MSLFNHGLFKLHSGEATRLKIDCDVLTDDDYKTLAKIIANSHAFRSVEGVPSGGNALAEWLSPLASPAISTWHLIVDDVYTTGQSMELARAKAVGRGKDFNTIRGVVIFARNPTPDWIWPIFSLNPKINVN